jgi:hypothetical protein
VHADGSHQGRALLQRLGSSGGGALCGGLGGAMYCGLHSAHQHAEVDVGLGSGGLRRRSVGHHGRLQRDRFGLQVCMRLSPQPHQ